MGINCQRSSHDSEVISNGCCCSERVWWPATAQRNSGEATRTLLWWALVRKLCSAWLQVVLHNPKGVILVYGKWYREPQRATGGGTRCMQAPESEPGSRVTSGGTSVCSARYIGSESQKSLLYPRFGADVSFWGEAYSGWRVQLLIFTP